MFVSVLARRLRPGKTYEVTEEFDFSTDQTVAQGRPPYVANRPT